MVRLWQIIVWTLRGLALMVVLGLSALLLWVAWTMHTQGIRVLGVQTGSMVPALRIGDAIVVRPQPFQTLTAGQIVSYQSDTGALISHRLRMVNQLNKSFIPQGDHNAQPDGVFAAPQIIGSVQYVLPGLGRISSLLHRPVVLVNGVYFPATIWIFWQLRILERQVKRTYRLRRRQILRV